MYCTGIDAHQKSSTICVVDRRGRKVHRSHIHTSAEGFRVGLERWARRGLVAVESSGITPWVAELLSGLGPKVAVVTRMSVRLIGASACLPATSSAPRDGSQL